MVKLLSMKMNNLLRCAAYLTIPVVLSGTLVTSVLAEEKPFGVGMHPNVASDASGSTRACQAREGVIKTRLTHLVSLATNMEAKFDAIAGRVENYYTTKVVPSGKTVSNYNSLLTDIQNKKASVFAVLTKAKTDANNFTCTNVKPKDQLTQFREDMQQTKSALKDYRTSIKNLIVAVHSAAGTHASESASPKPSGGAK